MKLLIVDDEKHMITAIRCLVPAERLGITQILSSQTAAEAKIILEKERPEIAIVDIILQRQTGMSLMSFIANHHLPTQVIAVSGHSDYDYVRTMLLNGAVDYLLKPVEGKALVASINKAIRRLRPEGSHPAPDERANAAPSEQYVRARLSRLLAPGTDTGDEAPRQIFPTEPCDCTLLYCDVDYLPMCRMDFHQSLSGFFEKVHSYVSLHACGYIVDRFNSRHECLIILNDDERREHLRQVEALASEVLGSSSFPFHAGVAEHVRFPDGFAGGVERARTAFFAVDALRVTDILQYHSGELLKASFPGLPPSEELERRLLSLIITQDQRLLISEAERWLDAALRRESVPLEMVKRVIELSRAMRARWEARLRELYPDLAGDAGAEQIRYADFVDEYFVFSPPMMTAGLLRSLSRFSERVGRHSTEDDIFKRIALYMEINYDRPFDQTEYAGMFHLNRDYLSRKFKQIYGEGMVSYLNRLRITRAEKLMHDPQMKIREIAYMTGFGDEKYFTRQFKEYYHITPSEYRNMLQLNQP